MGKTLSKLWFQIKIGGENAGLSFLIIGFVGVIVLSIVPLYGTELATFLSLALALMSVGLGFISVGISTKADKRQTDLLERLDKNVARLPSLVKGDILTESGKIVAKEMLEQQSRETAQRRLDEDTRRVGYVRGELFQHEDGSWSIAWGGKYRL